MYEDDLQLGTEIIGKLFAVTMVIMTLELWYIFKDYIIKSVHLQCATVKIL